MSTIVSSSSPPPSPPPHDEIPTATLALPSIAAVPSTSRRLPPPCWSPDETVALIHAYRDKWYSLRRGNLRANHWQEVADDVATRCPVNPAKTAVQCRHKMEKLRKRYRSEIQRAAAHGGVRRYSSTWAHFQIMHSMEKGPNSNPTPPSSSDDEEMGEERGNGVVKRVNEVYSHGFGGQGGRGGYWNQGSMDNGSAATGFRIKIPGTGRVPVARVYSKFDEMGVGQYGGNVNPRFVGVGAGVGAGANSTFGSGYGAGSGKGLKGGYMGKCEVGKRVGEMSRKKSGEGEGVGEVVAAIQALGEGFMRIEKVKMDMARQVEEMRMEMELKRTEMILESQQRIVEAFANAISEKSSKKAKRMSTSP